MKSLESLGRVSYLSGLFFAAHLSQSSFSEPLDLYLRDGMVSTRSLVSSVIPNTLEMERFANIGGTWPVPLLFRDELFEGGSEPLISLNVSRSIGGSEGYGLGVNGVPLLEVHQGVLRTSLADFFNRIRDSLLSSSSPAAR